VLPKNESFSSYFESFSSLKLSKFSDICQFGYSNKFLARELKMRFNLLTFPDLEIVYSILGKQSIFIKNFMKLTDL
jgi:hypothetical protein